ncbi:MAG: dipeptide ABC transporter permease DppC, partial [Bauldia sp.]|nr:dipeptide ABC transporter permease DppC [Bauldia sp.]
MSDAAPPADAPLAGAATASRRSRRGGLLSYLAFRHPLALGLVTLFLFAAIFGPWIAPHSMTDTDLSMALKGSSAEHLLGTDPLGRDVLSRLLGSARVAAEAFLIVVLIGGIFGTLLGTLAGGLGGLLDLVVSRVTEVVQGFPTVLVAIVIVALLGPSLVNAMVAVG